MYEKIYRAGMIPYHIDEDATVRMLFCVPSDPAYGGDKFQLCKGRIEQDESSKEAAIREAQEELGLFRSNIIGEVHHLGNYLGRTEVYVCKISDPELFGVPDYEIGDTRWLTHEEFMDIGRELHYGVVTDAYNWIIEVEQLDE